MCYEWSQNLGKGPATKALPLESRKTLLSIYCKHQVSTVYSGHTHFTHFPEPYQCPGTDDTVRQIVLTSISAQLEWVSESGKHFPAGKETPGEPQILMATVNAEGEVKTELIDLHDNIYLK